MAGTGAKPLSPGELARARELFAAGYSCNKIGPILGRSKTTIANALVEIGARQRDVGHGFAPTHIKGQRSIRSTSGYSNWQSMLARCYSVGSPAYKRYGARGITVCERWRRSFQLFIADMGPRPSPAHTLDRFPDRHGNYEPGNVRWATPAEQNRNKDNNKLIPFGSGIAIVADAAPAVGLKRPTVYNRLRNGVPPERALDAIRRTSVCSVAGCERREKCSGLCSMHYQRANKRPRQRLSDEQRKQSLLAGAQKRLATLERRRSGRFAVLDALAGESSAAALAKQLGKTPGGVRMSLYSLEAEGLVRRVGLGRWVRV